MRIRSFCRFVTLGVASSAVIHCGGGEPGATQPGALAQQAQASETTTVPTTLQTMGRLGQGRDLVKEELRAECVRSATTVTIPTQEAVLRFDSSMLREEASQMLGFSMDAKARFGLVNASAKAKFSRSLTSNSLSLAMFYSADYNLGVQKLDEGALQWLVDRNSPDWISRCGDEFMLQKQVGGQLFLLYRIDFSSMDAKREFEASVGASWPAGEANVQMTEKASQFQGRASVHVEAYQSGGDVTRLSSILGGTTPSGEAGRVVLDCSMQNLEPCGTFMQNAIAYASSQSPGSFSDTLRTTPADRKYLFKDWGMLGVNIPARTVGAEIRTARLSLQQRFDKQVEFQERVAMLKSGRLYVPPSLRPQLDGFELAVHRNLSLISDAVYACYDAITNPQDPAQINACVNGANINTLVSRGYDPNLTMDRLSVDMRLPYVFGGMYQVDDYSTRWNANNVVNPVTNTLGCPSGFTARQFGRVRAPESLNGATQYFCVAPHNGTTRGWSFTGAYQIDDRGSSGNNVFNLYAGAGGLGCPQGTGSAYKFGRAIGPESGWGVTQYLCSLSTFSPEKMAFGGMYQVDDCNGRNNVINPMSGTVGCPDGFSAVRMARVKMPESQCGGVQYVCKLN